MNAVDNRSPAFKAPLKFFGGHSRAMKEVAGAAPNLLVDYSVALRYVVIHSGVNQHKFEAMLFAEKVYSGATLGKMAELLPGHLLGRDGDALLYNAMIGGE